MKVKSEENEETLIDRAHIIGGEIIELGDGFRGLVGYGGFSTVAYIELPPGHPDIGKGYNDLDPEVNGGLTYAHGRVFGWDYGHAYNTGTPSEDMQNAYYYFKNRM